MFYVCSFLIKIKEDLDFACVYICRGENEHLFRLIDLIQQFNNRYRIIWIKTDGFLFSVEQQLVERKIPQKSELLSLYNVREFLTG